MADKDAFEEFINKINMGLSAKGLPAPDIENIDEGSLQGDVLKISYDVYLFMNHEKPKYYMLPTSQKMTNLGTMSLKDAILKFNRLSKHKRG